MVRFSVDCTASVVQVGVERLAAVDNSKEFSSDVWVPASTSARALLVKAKGLRSCVRVEPRPFNFRMVSSFG